MPAVFFISGDIVKQMAAIGVGGFTGWGAPPVTEARFLSSLETYLRSAGYPPACPSGRNRHVGSFRVAGVDYYVKYYRVRRMKARLQSWLRCSQSYKAWRYAHQLAELGIRTPPAIAHLKRGSVLGKQEHLLITMGIAGQTLQDAIEAQSELRPHRALLRAMAAFLAQLHDSGVYHGDFSALNTIVQKDAAADVGWRIFLIDLDAVRSVRHISLRRQIKNLDELGRNFTSLKRVSIRDRLRFLCYYQRARMKPAHTTAWLQTKVCRRTARRMQGYGKRFEPAD